MPNERDTELERLRELAKRCPLKVAQVEWLIIQVDTLQADLLEAWRALETMDSRRAKASTALAELRRVATDADNAAQQQLADLTARCARVEGEADEAKRLVLRYIAWVSPEIHAGVRDGARAEGELDGYARGVEAAIYALGGRNCSCAYALRQLKPEGTASAGEGEPTPK